MEHNVNLLLQQAAIGLAQAEPVDGNVALDGYYLLEKLAVLILVRKRPAFKELNETFLGGNIVFGPEENVNLASVMAGFQYLP